MLSKLTVVNNSDSAAGSLRAEISAANNGDTIRFAPALAGQTITLTSGELAVGADSCAQPASVRHADVWLG
jgi:hypothetical protein